MESKDKLHGLVSFNMNSEFIMGFESDEVV